MSAQRLLLHHPDGTPVAPHCTGNTVEDWYERLDAAHVPDDYDPIEAASWQDTPCVECGETGACAWDAEGRPLIHAHNGEGETT